MAVLDLTPTARAPRVWRKFLIASAVFASAALLVALLAFPQLRAELAHGLDTLLAAAQRGHVGLPVAIIVFVVTAYVGAPRRC